MSTATNRKKAKQLGIPHGTAANRLRKAILFQLLQEAGKNVCFQCGERIENIEDLSVEHKTPWLDSENPAENFFDLNNIAFSHLACNSSASRRRSGIFAKHGTSSRYKRGCRCNECRNASRIERSRTRRIDGTEAAQF